MITPIVVPVAVSSSFAVIQHNVVDGQETPVREEEELTMDDSLHVVPPFQVNTI
jgi:hypothetical protein